MALTSQQLSAMTSAGQAAPTQPKNSNPPWLQAMLDAGMDSTQSATTLGHATSMLQKTFQSPMQNISSGNAGENVDVATGALKQGAKDLSMAGMQNAGPVGAQIMADAQAKGGGAAKFAQGITDFNTNMQPSNAAQQSGATLTAIGEAVSPLGSETINGLIGTASDKIGGFLGKLADSTGVTKFLADRSVSKATQALQSTAETMTKGERESAIASGRLTPTLTGGGKYVASDTEKNAGQILAGKLERNPVKNVPIVQNEIATRGKEAETFLEQNSKPITNQEHADMFGEKRAEMEKYSTPAELKAYDEQVGLFSKQLPGRGGYNTANYYKALKEYETNVTSKLAKGKEALLSETGSAKLQAAKDVRSVVRDMIGEKNPEFKGKMFDLASLYDAKDNVISKAEKIGKSGIKEFAKRHPVISGAVGALAGEQLLRKGEEVTGL